MSNYLHHVPGRLRIRSSSFRCDPISARQAEDQLRLTEGVREVRVNPRAGSITVHYDPERLTRAQILERLERVGCLGAAVHADQGNARIPELIGKALVGAVVKNAVERSALRLVSVLI
ncbi:MAG: heavy-metal-associated domain-containing protein [Sphingobacteriia bacterium]|nr:heavy-metal-associated domain-containing protein [Sphingobacteriia bacterium]NCC41174.1 heavy-metal-associated domain-containing protein [Gammaproteobacteria bacterium]